MDGEWQQDERRTEPNPFWRETVGAQCRGYATQEVWSGTQYRKCGVVCNTGSVEWYAIQEVWSGMQYRKCGVDIRKVVPNNLTMSTNTLT